MHHAPGLPPQRRALQRLLADVLEEPGAKQKPLDLPESLAAALDCFHRFPERGGDALAQTLAQILALANWLDERIESYAFDRGERHPDERIPLWESLEDLRGLFSEKLWLAARTLFPAAAVNRCWQIPVQPDVARELVSLLGQRERCSLTRLGRVASRDPAIAGGLVQAANSPLFHARMRIRSVQHALAYLGENASRRIITGLVARLLFGDSAALRQLWRHSLRTAQFLENLAAAGGLLEPNEAMLTGLVHDIGCIAIVRQKEAPMYARLTAAGPATWAEILLYGQDHAELGANILESWRFPEPIVAAVRFHHRPADAPGDAAAAGAAALYAAEFHMETDEDLPSLRHLRSAIAGAGFRPDELARFDACDPAVTALLKIA